MSTSVFWFVIIVYLFTACGSQRDFLKNDRNIELVVSTELSLPLDSLSSDYSPSIQLLADGNQKLLYVNDRTCKCINVYDLETRSLYTKIFLQREGPDGIPGNQIGMYVHSSDSIFIHSTLVPRLSLIDGRGKLKNTYPLIDKSSTDIPGYNSFPIGTTTRPMHLSRDELKMNTYNIDQVKDHTTIFTQLVLNIRTGAIRYNYPRPASYNQGNWGSASFRASHYVVVVPDLTLINHGNLDNLLVIGTDERIREVYAGSYYIGDLKPISSNLDDHIDNQTTQQVEARTGCYAGLVYNPFRHTFYRFVVLPVPDSKRELYKSGELNSIVILDRDFKKIGEHIFPDNRYNFAMRFVDENGLHVFNRKKFKESGGDSLTFDVLVEKPVE
jgi:hypothetical protein